MDNKYIIFYEKFIPNSKTLSDCGIILLCPNIKIDTVGLILKKEVFTYV